MAGQLNFIGFPEPIDLELANLKNLVRNGDAINVVYVVVPEESYPNFSAEYHAGNRVKTIFISELSWKTDFEQSLKSYFKPLTPEIWDKAYCRHIQSKVLDDTLAIPLGTAIKSFYIFPAKEVCSHFCPSCSCNDLLP